MVDAETQGMIGYELEQELRNVLPHSTNVAALLTQVEVDPKDPAFLTPTKPIGPFYESDPTGTMAKIDGRYRRVVASPKPKRIVEIETIKQLIQAGTVVVCAGGGGIPVAMLPNGHLQGVAAVIDKDRTSALLAGLICIYFVLPFFLLKCAFQECVGADALIMLTDIDSVYVDFKKPTQKKLDVVDASTLPSKEEAWILEQLPAGSMRPKFEAALQFARAAGGAAWSSIGRMEDLPEILDGTKGTRVVASAKTASRTMVAPALPSFSKDWGKSAASWTATEVESWLASSVRLPPPEVQRVLAIAKVRGGKMEQLFQV